MLTCITAILHILRITVKNRLCSSGSFKCEIAQSVNMYASCGSVCCAHICSIFSSFCVINSLPGWYFGHRYPVPKCVTEWIPWQLVGDRRDLIDHEKPCAVRETHILRRCRHDLNNWEAMQLCKGCRIRTCTLAKTKLLLLFLSKEKGVKVAELWRCRFWMSRTGMNCMAWLCMLLFLGSMRCCWDLVHTIKSQAQKWKKQGNWFVAFTLLFPVHAYLWL